jgi:serine/threonine-protein kinase
MPRQAIVAGVHGELEGNDVTTAPSQLGSYIIECEIGRGGMGVVYRARDPRLDRLVAIKTLPVEVAGDPERLARFEREARILASLRHPGIAGIHSIEDSGGTRYLALEYIEGPTLAERIEHHRLPVAEALDVCRQIAAALEAAHEAGVIHRDLKPSNVKITPEGVTKVLDFGLARTEESVDPEASRSPTRTVGATQVGVILGTAAYMSPEQARGRALDRRTDIWSFGCVLYECLTGRQAFSGETVSDIIAKILEREPNLDVLPAETPERVVDLLERCLVKDPRHRLRDIGDARVVLEKVLAARSPSGNLLVSDTVASRSVRSGRVRRWAAAAGAVGLALGVALGFWAAPRLIHHPTPLRSLAVAMPAEHTIRNSLITPDGRTVMVAAVPHTSVGGDGTTARMMTRPIGTTDFGVLPGTSGFQGSMISADGRSLLMIMPVSGTNQRQIVRMPIDGNAPPTSVVDWRDSWNTMTPLTNGDILVTDGPTSFVRVPGTGGTPSASIPMKVAGNIKVSQIDLLWARLPDGNPFVNVIAYDSRGWHYNVGVLDSRSGRVTLVVEDGGNAVYVPKGSILVFARGRSVFAARFDPMRRTIRGAPVAVWSGLRTNLEARPGFFRVLDDGSIYYAPGGSGENRTLAILDASGSITTWSPERRAFDDQPSISPDGRHFVCSVANGRGIDELWIGDLASTRLRRLGTDPDADCSAGVWSPDGAQIAYKRQGQDGRDGIYVQPVSGGPARRVLKPESNDVAYRTLAWLPNGWGLYVTRQPPGKSKLARLPATDHEVDGSSLVEMSPTSGNVFTARMSPDGRWLTFLSDDSGRNEVYVAPITAGGSLGPSTAISSDGASNCSWSIDGRSVLFGDLQNHVLEVPLTTDGKPSTEPKQRLNVQQLNLAMWSPLPGGRFLVRLRSEDEGEIAYYQLVQGWRDEVERRLRAAH